jgi:uncharacterized protein (TIGR02265 family)
LGEDAGLVSRVSFTPAEPLSGSFDPEVIAKSVPPDYAVKGMFFARLAAQLGAGFAAVAERLESPPRFGRYVPFSDYPQADYVRVSAAAAQKLYPGIPLREGMRRLGRDDFGVFAASTFGKVILAAVGDARSALLKTPFIYQKMAPGPWTVTGEELDDSTIRLEFAPVHGTWEYQLGQLEGIVQNFGASPVTVVSELPGRKIQFDVRHRT